MKEKTGKGTNYSYDDILDGVTDVARRKEEEAVEKGFDRAKAGEEIPADMGMRVKRARESEPIANRARAFPVTMPESPQQMKGTNANDTCSPNACLTTMSTRW